MNRKELIKCAEEIQRHCSEHAYCIEDECPFMTHDRCVFDVNESYIPEYWNIEALQAEED